jgi:hypothetical protein
VGVPNALAFNGAGDLFVANAGGTIIQFSTSEAQSIFASSLNFPQKLAFNNGGDLFVVDAQGTIFEFTPSGVQSNFASGVSGSGPLAFQGVALPVPEPSVLVMMGMGAFVFAGLRRFKRD